MAIALKYNIQAHRVLDRRRIMFSAVPIEFLEASLETMLVHKVEYAVD